MIKNETVDRLATLYGGDKTVLYDLLRVLESFIRREVSKAASRAAVRGLTIPVEDFESHFTQAVWKAVERYDGRSHFIQRYRLFMKIAEIDVWRQYRTYINGEAKYTKARIHSLDASIGNNGETLGNMILANMQCQAQRTKSSIS